MNGKSESLKRLLRIVYSDIIRGYSYSSKFDCYIKHLDDEDMSLVGEKEEEAKRESIESGLLTERQKITELIEHEVWTPQQESLISLLSKNIENNIRKKNIINSVAIQETTQEAIDKEEKELSKIKYRRDALLGLTVEKYMTRKRSDITIYQSFFKDRECKEFIWTLQEFEEMDQEELYDYIKEYNKVFDSFNHINIQRIAALPYFLNKFFIANADPLVFMGKAAIALTQFQAELLSQGRTYKSILENNEKGESPPDSFYDDPDKLVKWYTSQLKSKTSQTPEMDKKLSSSGKDSITATSVVDADKETLDAMAASQGASVMNLDEEIKKKMKQTGRKELDMIDLLEVHGENTAGLTRR